MESDEQSSFGGQRNLAASLPRVIRNQCAHREKEAVHRHLTQLSIQKNKPAKPANSFAGYFKLLKLKQLIELP